MHTCIYVFLKKTPSICCIAKLRIKVYAIHEDNRSVKSVEKNHAEQETTTTKERPTSHKPMIILSKLSNFLKRCLETVANVHSIYNSPDCPSNP